MGCGLSTHLGSDPCPDAPFLLVGKDRSIEIFLLSRITKTIGSAGTAYFLTCSFDVYVFFGSLVLVNIPFVPMDPLCETKDGCVFGFMVKDMMCLLCLVLLPILSGWRWRTFPCRPHWHPYYLPN